ncbi:MAG: hypothetical protein ACREON_01255 [Gemmatimonadaceae bacterium]
MSTAAVLALALVAIWLVLLSFVVVLLIRQVGLITLRLDYSSRPEDDGLTIGSSIPPEAGVLLEEHAEEPLYLFFASPTCAPCAKVIVDLDRYDFANRVVTCVPGSDELSSDFVSLFPEEVRVIRDPKASELWRAFSIKSTPLVFQIESGIITGRAYPMSGRDFARLVDARAQSDADELVRLAIGSGR